MTDPKPRLLPVLLVNLIGALGFSIVMPFLIFLVQDFGGNSVVYGLIGATYPLFQFFGAPVLGRWSDKLGRRRVLLISQAGTLASWLLFCGAVLAPRLTFAAVDLPIIGAFELTLPLLMLGAARAVDGLTGGNISVANAYVADVSTDQNRARNFGRMGVAFSAGMIAGPALAGVLAGTSLGNSLPVYVATAVSFVTLGVIYFMMPHRKPHPLEALHPQRDHAAHVFGVEHRDCHQAHVQQTLPIPVSERPEIRYMLALQLVVLLGFNLYYAAFPVHAAEGLNWEVERTGFYFMIMSVVLVIVEGPILGRLSTMLSPTRLIVGGLSLLAVHFVALTYLTGDSVMLVALLFSIGNGLMWPTMTSFLAGLAQPEDQGAVQGLAGSASSAAAVAGLVIGGVLFAVLAENIFLISAALFGIGAVLALRLPRLAAH